ncbi:MAG TPA: hypothetical protein VK203_08000 [Nostocaceae cyanobacterium]|nr:hypothetical protein [Nostocaceae cyanobacterium]
MIDVRTAVYAVYQYITPVEDMMGINLKEARLEEAELSEDKRYWLITLGFEVPKKVNKNILGSIISTDTTVEYRKEYKLFKVNSETSEVEAMKIREITSKSEQKKD